MEFYILSFIFYTLTALTHSLIKKYHHNALLLFIIYMYMFLLIIKNVLRLSAIVYLVINYVGGGVV